MGSSAPAVAEVTAPLPTRSAAQSRGRYIPSLDGWRALAIVWVVISHNQLWTLGRMNDSWVKESGDRAVMLFFALSGYLICTRLLQEERKAGSISLRSFYLRRLFRIQPAALLYLSVVWMLGVAGVIALHWRGLAGAALMVRNYWPGGRPAGNWYAAHFWSLAVEEHFYLLLPGLLVLSSRGKWPRRRLLLGALAVAAVEFWRIVMLWHPEWDHLPGDLYQRTDMTIGGILLGSVFALALDRERMLLWARRWLQPWMATLYAVLVMWVLRVHHTSYYHVALITVFPLLIVATALHPHSPLTRVLEWAPVRWVGRISYSLYLWQQLFFNGMEPPQPGSFRSHTVLCWVLAIACASASYYLVETPLIRIGHRMAARRGGAEHVQEVAVAVG